MYRYLLRQWQFRRHQHGRPVETMEARNIFPDHMCIGRPVAGKLLSIVGKTNSGQVVGEGIKPDIDHLFGIVWYRNAPIFQPWTDLARDRKISQPLANKPDHLGTTRGW